MKQRSERIVAESGLEQPQPVERGELQTPFGLALGVEIDADPEGLREEEPSPYKLHYTYFNSKPGKGHDDIEFLDQVVRDEVGLPVPGP